MKFTRWRTHVVRDRTTSVNVTVLMKLEEAVPFFFRVIVELTSTKESGVPCHFPAKATCLVNVWVIFTHRRDSGEGFTSSGIRLQSVYFSHVIINIGMFTLVIVLLSTFVKTHVLQISSNFCNSALSAVVDTIWAGAMIRTVTTCAITITTWIFSVRVTS